MYITFRLSLIFTCSQEIQFLFLLQFYKLRVEIFFNLETES